MATEYTDAQMLTEFRAAMMALATSQSYSINGKTVTRADLTSIRNTIEWLEGRIDADSGGEGTGGGSVLVRFNQP